MFKNELGNPPAAYVSLGRQTCSRDQIFFCDLGEILVDRIYIPKNNPRIS
jgi:hypothetical protein